MKPRNEMKKTKTETRKNKDDKDKNPDKIEDKWRPSDVVKEPGADGEAYLIGKKLGKGGFAVCFEGRSERTSELYALKVVKSHVEQKKQLEKVSTFFNHYQPSLTHCDSSVPSFKSMRKCITPILSNSTGPFLLENILMLSSNSVPTVPSWIWSKAGAV